MTSQVIDVKDFSLYTILGLFHWRPAY